MNTYVKRFIGYLLSISLIVTGMPLFLGNDISFAGEDKKEKPKKTMAYIPLDNRPVNVDRVIYEAESAGFTVLMPDEDLYSTKLDGQPKNSNGTQYGDTKKLVEWIESVDDKTDYYVISLDQLLSGGLVNSREMSDTDNREEYVILDKIIKLSYTNRVYIVDTVARLATCTSNYNNVDLNAYYYIRYYNMQPRYVLADENLSLNNVLSSYRQNVKGSMIDINREYEEQIRKSLNVRERKLRLIDYISSGDRGGNIKYFIGIDDSNPQNTIQSNEVNFLRKKLKDKGTIFSGADELGMVATLSLMIDYYGNAPKVYTKYFGDTEGTHSGSVYDMENVKENVEKHLESMNVSITKDRKEANIEVVVLTVPKEKKLDIKYLNSTIDYINGNISAGIPTIVINTAASEYSNNLEYRMTRECEMSMLLAYSSWGTVGNAIGVALCNGISRYMYLTEGESSDAADIAFIKGLVFSYVKDISYIRGGGKALFNDYITKNRWELGNFYQNPKQVAEVNQELKTILMEKEYNVTVKDILGNLTGCRYIKGLQGQSGIIAGINISNFSEPFYRTYEIRFDIFARLKKATMSSIKAPMYVEIPYTPPQGQTAYSMEIFYSDKDGKTRSLPYTYDKAKGVIKVRFDLLGNIYASILSMDEVQAVSLFSDVSPKAWYFNDVLYVYQSKIMNGTSANIFSPNMNITGEMLAKVLDRIGKTDKNTAEEFEDILRATKNGKANPMKEPLTKEETARCIYRYAELENLATLDAGGKTSEAYSDCLNLSEESKKAVDWVSKNKILTGNQLGQMQPNKFITRAEAAVIFKRLSEI